VFELVTHTFEAWDILRCRSNSVIRMAMPLRDDPVSQRCIANDEMPR